MRVLPPSDPEEPSPEIDVAVLATAREATHLASLAARVAPPDSRASHEARKASIDASDAMFRLQDELRAATGDATGRLAALLRVLTEAEGAVAAARLALVEGGLGNGQPDGGREARREDVREVIWRRLPLLGESCMAPPPRKVSRNP